ncbi:hypothetical protein Bca4012_008879 [Brassica carinata]
MFLVHDGCTYDELLQMAQEDYDLDKKTEMVELTYFLPDVLLEQMGPDTPPMHVTSDRQVRNLIELCKTHIIRLCVSSQCQVKAGGDDDADVSDGGDSIYADEDYDEGLDEDWNVVDDDDAVNYSDYGKVKDEDSDDEGFYHGQQAEYAGAGGRLLSFIEDIYVGQSFASKAELVAKLKLVAVKGKFIFTAYKTTKTLYVAKCRVEGCGWKLRASVKHGPKTFWVTKYLKKHTCSVGDRIAQRKHYTPKYVASLFIENVGIIDGITPKHIEDSMRNMFGLNLGYTTSYRALLCAQELVRGTAEDGYENLPSYLRQIEQSNPGTVTCLEKDGKNRFKYLFLSFGASIAGFNYLRRVLVVDGTHLSGKYEGVMLVAAAQDGNFQIFPLAFAIVDGENDDSWEWFFTQLRRCVSDQYALVIVSDRHKSIKTACEKVFPWAKRGICYYHLQQNIVQKFKGKHMLYLVKGAAYAHTLFDFNRYMDEIRSINPNLAKYLEDADVSLWSRVHFQGDRYNIKTSNIAESINSALKPARGFPISFLLEFIREKLGRWFFKRREDALSLTSQHSRGVENLLAIREEYADMMKVERIDGWRFVVKGGRRDCIVDLELRRCQCGVFDIEKIPCSHAIAAAKDVNIHVFTLVCRSYSKEFLYAAYAANIYPKNKKASNNHKCLPPPVKRGPGRQKKSRWQSWLEISRMRGNKPRKQHKDYRCSQCKKPGHTRPNCPG